MLWLKSECTIGSDVLLKCFTKIFSNDVPLSNWIQIEKVNYLKMVDSSVQSMLKI